MANTPPISAAHIVAFVSHYETRPDTQGLTADQWQSKFVAWMCHPLRRVHDNGPTEQHSAAIERLGEIPDAGE